MSDDLRERIAVMLHRCDGLQPSDLIPEHYFLEADVLIAAGIGDVSAERKRANKLQRIIDGYDRTPAEERAKRAEERVEQAEALAYRTRDALHALQARIDAAKKFATSERDSIRGQYGASGSVYAGYANACDDFLAALVSEEPAPEPPKLDPKRVIDEHMQMVAHRVIDVFENADDEDTAEDIMQPVFEAIGLVQAFTHEHQDEVQS